MRTPIPPNDNQISLLKPVAKKAVRRLQCLGATTPQQALYQLPSSRWYLQLFSIVGALNFLVRPHSFADTLSLFGVHNVLQRIRVQNMNMALFDFDNAVIHKF